MNEPLAERLRPNNLDEYIGQEHLIGPSGTLKNLILKGSVPSLILWGPPGIGKTTLANIIAKESKRPFYALSAINSGVKDVRDVIEKAKRSGEGLFGSKSPILFIDEIHRFSKSQQDSLLGAVEKGWITLIGATTENPSFEVIPALLSRCQLYILEPLVKKDLIHLLDRAIKEDLKLSQKNIELKEYEALLRLSGGDARKLLNIFELIIENSEAPISITNDFVLQNVQQNMVRYDKTGEQHYDIISAFIKSIRGSDPNGAVYWLARMIEGGEDLKFIARRLLILSSEDIGNANPNALVLANSAFQAVSTIGYPESRIILSQLAVYLANSEKSNASYEAIGKAQALVKETGDLSIPLHLRNAPTQLMKDLNYGKGYKYAHSFEGNFAVQEYLPEQIKDTVFYSPGDNAKERSFREVLRKRWGSKYNY